MNAGEAYRLGTAEVMGVLREPGAGLWRYRNNDWAHPERSGDLVPASALEDAVRGGRLASLLEGFRFDWDRDGQFEVLLVPKVKPGSDAARFAPTLLRRDASGGLMLGTRPLVLPGEVYALEDIRDQDRDGRLELILSAQVGSNTFYTYYAIWAVDGVGAVQRFVTRAPDTLHLVDLERSGRIQILVRHLISQSGPVRLWNWVDEVVEWNGSRFVSEPQRLLSFHDQVTKRRLVDELIDSYDEDFFILKTKVDLMRQVHAQVQGKRPIQVARTDLREQVSKLRTPEHRERAYALLQAELVRDPYDVDARSILAELYMEVGAYGEALSEWYRVLGVDPDNGATWQAAGVCFARLQERSAAVASFVNSVRLVEEKNARLEKLRRALQREGEEASVVAALRQAVEILEGRAREGAASGQVPVRDDAEWE